MSDLYTTQSTKASPRSRICRDKMDFWRHLVSFDWFAIELCMEWQIYISNILGKTFVFFIWYTLFKSKTDDIKNIFIIIYCILFNYLSYASISFCPFLMLYINSFTFPGFLTLRTMVECLQCSCKIFALINICVSTFIHFLSANVFPVTTRNVLKYFSQTIRTLLVY